VKNKKISVLLKSRISLAFFENLKDQESFFFSFSTISRIRKFRGNSIVSSCTKAQRYILFQYFALKSDSVASFLDLKLSEVSISAPKSVLFNLLF
jgi:hypothetical protein